MNRTRYQLEDRDILNSIMPYLFNGSLSLRKAARYLEAKTGKKISPEGLRKIVNKERLEQSDGRADNTGLGNEPG